MSLTIVVYPFFTLFLHGSSTSQQSTFEMNLVFLAIFTCTLSLSEANVKCPEFSHTDEIFDLRLVSQLNLNSPDNLKFHLQYLGTWYEIARTEIPFEQDMDCVNSTYSLREDGTIDIVNAGKILKCLEITVKIIHKLIGKN